MRVAFLDPLEDRLRDFPAEYFPTPEYEVLLSPGTGKLPDGFETAEAAIWWDTRLDRALIERMPNLKFLQRIGWFRAKGNATAALERDIPVAVTPFGVSDRVAQHAFTLTLNLVRQMPVALEALQEGTNPDHLREEEQIGPTLTVNWARIPNIGSLNDKTIGILGFGEIGSCYARLVTPFCARVLANRRRPLTREQERFYGVEYTLSVDEVMSTSDVVLTQVPYNSENHHMLKERELRMMKPTAYFVNCGRANTVDEQALYRVLKEKSIAGAGLDVFSVEPLPFSHPLRGLPNVILTPHTAGGVAGWTDTFARIRENLERVKAGRPVILPMGRNDPQPE
ncbi:MAG: hypothetical protein HW403_770 [Dehalococcoidia bacterium]|nr:hypothetical protein [Dehalococcoidia bacterium]